MFKKNTEYKPIKYNGKFKKINVNKISKGNFCSNLVRNIHFIRT